MDSRRIPTVYNSFHLTILNQLSLPADFVLKQSIIDKVDSQRITTLEQNAKRECSILASCNFMLTGDLNQLRTSLQLNSYRDPLIIPNSQLQPESTTTSSKSHQRAQIPYPTSSSSSSSRSSSRTLSNKSTLLNTSIDSGSVAVASSQIEALQGQVRVLQEEIEAENSTTERKVRSIRNTWTSAEDAELQALVHTYRDQYGPWHLIASGMTTNRTHHACRERYRYIKKKKNLATSLVSIIPEASLSTRPTLSLPDQAPPVPTPPVSVIPSPTSYAFNPLFYANARSRIESSNETTSNSSPSTLSLLSLPIPLALTPQPPPSPLSKPSTFEPLIFPTVKTIWSYEEIEKLVEVIGKEGEIIDSAFYWNEIQLKLGTNKSSLECREAWMGFQGIRRSLNV